MNQIRIASDSDRDEVNRIRIAEYSRSTEFTLLSPNHFHWQASESGVVMGVWSSETLISTMQGTLVSNRIEAENLLECAVDNPNVQYPSLALTRAATVKDFRASGLNSILRYYFLVAAQRSARSIIGGVYAKAPRLETMLSIGYEFFGTTSWLKDLDDYSGRQLAVLPGDRIHSAIKRLAVSEADNLKKYSWTGEEVDLGDPVCR